MAPISIAEYLGVKIDTVTSPGHGKILLIFIAFKASSKLSRYQVNNATPQ